MVRRWFLAGLAATLGIGGARVQARAPADFPLVPAWKPSFEQPRDRLIATMDYYYDRKSDFVVFAHGTCVMVPDGFRDAAARAVGVDALRAILNAHPDMTPSSMADGNILVRFNDNAAIVVLRDVARANWKEIEARHLDGLMRDEVLITPLGPNKFDNFAKQALLGRAYMFLDAQQPRVVHIHRHGVAQAL